MNTYDGLYAGASQLERYRRRQQHPTTPARVAAAKRELAAVTHIPGDLSAEDIDQRFYAALAAIHWRRRAERSA